MNEINEDDDYYNYCPTCGVNWSNNPKEHKCDEGELIWREKPRFYVMDLNNYTTEFLQEIILWYDKWSDYLETRIKDGRGIKEKEGGVL